jgi:hypothetical protein
VLSLTNLDLLDFFLSKISCSPFPPEPPGFFPSSR